MKSFIKSAIIFSLFMVNSCIGNSPPTPSDFAFKIEGMFHDEINTFDGTYSRSGIERPAKKQMHNGQMVDLISISDSTVAFVLTKQESDSIYTFLKKINYTAFAPRIPTKCEERMDPSHTIKLTFRENNLTKVILYDDGCLTKKDEQANGIRAFMMLVQGISLRHKEVKAIPETMMLDM